MISFANQPDDDIPPCSLELLVVTIPDAGQLGFPEFRARVLEIVADARAPQGTPLVDVHIEWDGSRTNARVFMFFVERKP